ncbi:fructosamine kinase family protein [Corynebacterium hansenii]|uniref:Fructosamine kinase family protein n=1 Tax=Corynebacterium hansenii TaxID=394964 RepID=A0ABV7ZTG2_9CORY|nr:fructosamine kinase family protein [Corynebacterium hansenii]WJZ01246.1 Fructosamine kinase [Corynebacterium hansenii]
MFAKRSGNGWERPAAKAPDDTHVKTRPGAPAGFFALEAAGLRWLKEPEADGGARVVDVLEVGRNKLVLRKIAAERASAGKARRFGEALARTHDAGAAGFGAAPEGWERDGWFGPLDDPRTMRLTPRARFGEFWAHDRIAPAVAELGRRPGTYAPSELAVFERLVEKLLDGEFDDGEAPARVHGDLWWGNLMWDADGAVLIDPAAHGGHREEDLAMLGMFGVPHLDEIILGYESVHPLPGRESRAPLHRLYAVLMHAVLFGGGYAGQALEMAKRYA